MQSYSCKTCSETIPYRLSKPALLVVSTRDESEVVNAGREALIYAGAQGPSCHCWQMTAVI